MRIMMRLINWRPDGVIRRKGRSSAGKGGKSDEEKLRLQGGSPCLCRTRTIPLLALLSKY